VPVIEPDAVSADASTQSVAASSPTQVTATTWRDRLQEWKRGGNAAALDENRSQVVDRINDWFIRGAPRLQLDLSEQGITQYPPMPPEVTNVNLAGNRLKELPETLASDYPNLVHMNVSGNQLNRLPAVLPELQTLNVGSNQLEDFDTAVPDTLTWISLHNNRLTNIPERLLAMPHGANANLMDNRISQEAVQRMQTQMNDPSYNGPHFILPRITSTGVTK
jgi:Leucine-rich repeat (LRR) protein